LGSFFEGKIMPSVVRTKGTIGESDWGRIWEGVKSHDPMYRLLKELERNGNRSIPARNAFEFTQRPGEEEGPWMYRLRTRLEALNKIFKARELLVCLSVVEGWKSTSQFHVRLFKVRRTVAVRRRRKKQPRLPKKAGA
jgi:hypothetical protein